MAGDGSERFEGQIRDADFGELVDRDRATCFGFGYAMQTRFEKLDIQMPMGEHVFDAPDGFLL